MKVSIIIPTYKDNVALKLILDALQYQTYKNFEIIIAEDTQESSTKKLIYNYKSIYPIKHFFQEDKGNRKAIILNKVILKLKGEYLIFIDGDVIPYSTFIDSHVKLSEKKSILCGRRINIGDKVSKDLREGIITARELENKFLRKYLYLTSDNIRHYEQGLRFKPNGFISKFLNSKKKQHILGSNFSCYKEDLIYINGFDEDIIGGSKDDVDLEWRFKMAGFKLKSCKYFANLFHLNHSRKSRVEEEKIAKIQMQKNKKNKKFIAKNGIYKYG